ncbi:MAG: C25 family cysteine peptidase [Bacteroidota bacterium]|nr:C25 family cysteine peptidase [Bacteroidota bacterium]
MTKRFLVLCLLTILFTKLDAQPYGNEWITYSQKYYKIKVSQEGIFRLDSTTLAAAGIAVGPSGLDPRNFQLFNKGIQQAIWVQGESDGKFNTGDFIEFYGKPNDGNSEGGMYTASSFIPNPYYSLINDTAAYFLTWNSSLTNTRLQIATDTAFSTYPVAPYFFKDEIQEFHSGYYAGETDPVGGTDARYTKSEGWFDGNTLYMGTSVSYNLNTASRFLSGPNALIQTVALGASKDAALLGTGSSDHHLNITYNGNAFKDSLFNGYEANRFTGYVPVASLGASTTNFVFNSITDPGFTSNRTAISYIRVKYPHTFDLESKSSFMMYIPDTSSIASSLNISNFNASTPVFMYDLLNSRRISAQSSGSNYQAVISNSGTEKKVYISSEGNIISVNNLQPVTPSAQFTDYTSGIIDSAFIIVTHSLLNVGSSQYAIYRSGMSGGSHNVIMTDIDQLYDQFAHGIVKSPFAIRGLADKMLDVNPAFPPRNLFLIGKSLHLEAIRQDPSLYGKCLVPSFGNPSSDHLLTGGLNGTVFEPAIPTGRLAAQNDGHVDLYRTKMVDYEAALPDEWMKQVLHFGGGLTFSEQNTFKIYLNSYKSIIEAPLFGGNVKDFFKTTSAPIEINSSDTLHDLIDNGVSLMTFFGHASGSGFDQSIDDLSTYNPIPGHYPFLLANSCYAGDLHAIDYTAFGYPLSSSETFVLTANKGMIGYLGSVGLGVPYSLDNFSSEFYNQLSNASYGKSVGEQIKNAISSLTTVALIDVLTRETCFEMTLHGDPAMIINSHPYPDYKIENNDVSFDVISDVNNFYVSVERTNIGKSTNDTIFTELFRTYPNGDTASYILSSVAPYFKDTIVFTIPFDFSKDIGLNKFRVMLDSYSEVDEMSETNNTTGEIDLVINGGDIVPVYPYEFAIVPADTITLKASTANPFAAAKNYIFQVDTTDTFNSPFLKDTMINAPGGVLKWKLPFTFSDSTVYYWRVSPDSTSTTSGYTWRESSFQYLQGKRGWAQAHFFQYKNDGYQFVKFNRPLRKFEFVNDVKAIQCIDGIYPYIPYTDIVWKMNGYIKTYWHCNQLNPGFNFAVFNPISGENWLNPANVLPLTPCSSCLTGIYGNSSCRPYATNSFDFLAYDSTTRTNVSNFIDSVPNGYYVLGYSMNQHNFPSFEETVYDAFELIGSSQIRTVPQNRPYIIFGQKGEPGTAKEVIGDSISSNIQLDTTITTNWKDGFISSPVIGPAFSWDSLSWLQHHIDGASTADSIVVRLIGIQANGTETILANYTTGQLNITGLNSIVPAATYPNIRLVAFMKDTSLSTPPQMDRWQVMYTPVPEAAVNPPLGFSIANDTVQEGDNVLIHLPIQNISEFTFPDSMLVTYWLVDANQVIHPLPSKLKKKLLAPNEVIIDTISVNTNSYPGTNVLWVEANPVNKPASQLEQYHFNNIVRIPFYTSVDKINPLLDVTFDGVHILNNDIVSAKPNILVQLKDENDFLALNDTNDFKIFLQSPGGGVAKRIYFGSEMSFIPAVLPSNSCRINFTPFLPADGTYQLIVQAKDKSDNQSGSIDYKISFEIVNKATITEVMNYPNPFTTSTRFVFTLTGSEVPQNFKIQIMTITGKVVKEIFQDELGSLHVGRNITEYAWDGKDEFGDRLANGVYLYRVLTKLNGQNIEKKETEADQYFKKGWGKMYLMR